MSRRNREPIVKIRPDEGYFIRDFETNTVICPTGRTLTKKSRRANGYTRYMCKAACSRCESFRRCYHGTGKWKEIDFPAGAYYVKCRNWSKLPQNYEQETEKSEKS